MPVLVYNRERASNVASRMDQKAPIGFCGKLPDTTFRVIKHVNVFERADIPHQETSHRTARQMQSSHRPRGKPQEALTSEVDHTRELLRLLAIDRVMIDLGDQAGIAIDRIHRRFSTSP